ncbi:UNVERIFIED_CONTAM: Cytochrome c oxidase assembly protein cox19 [Siphonaria sp. JEL0065]|nr:Cytochrome c oxidase assembly protein cox19 [Siphonaria sp. JEL0065]
MSMGNNFQRTNIKAIPPERGAFPLDIEGLCKNQFQEYMSCMNEQKRGDHKKCRDLSKAYIECRMNTNLMEKDKMENIGFHESDKTKKKVGSSAGGSGGASVGGTSQSTPTTSL